MGNSRYHKSHHKKSQLEAHCHNVINLVLGHEQQQNRGSSISARNFSSTVSTDFSSCLSPLTLDDAAIPLEMVKTAVLGFIFGVSTFPGNTPCSAVGGETWQFSISIFCRICRISPRINFEIFSTCEQLWGVFLVDLHLDQKISTWTSLFSISLSLSFSLVCTPRLLLLAIEEIHNNHHLKNWNQLFYII